MQHHLEWSRSITGRLNQASTTQFKARAGEIAARLRKETSAGELPFLTMPYRAKLEKDMAALLPRLKKYNHMLVLGIGGSALGARAIQRAFAPGQDRPGHKGPWLWIADNVCAESMDAWFETLDPKDTVVVTISKSGGTIETLAQYFLARKWLQDSLGDGWSEHMVVVTDAKNGFLREEAARWQLPSMEVPDFLGGRYSALSAVGLLPAAWLGIDWQGLLNGAKYVADQLLSDTCDLPSHPAFELASWACALEQNGYSQLIFFCYIPTWATFGPWFAQLWAESLGKDGRGTMPVPAVGVTDQHSVNQMFLDGQRDKGCIFLTCANMPKGLPFPDGMPDTWGFLKKAHFGDLLEAEGLGTKMALAQSQTPLVHLEMQSKDAHAAGVLMMLLEAATIFSGWLMGINPVDQPAVELGKRLANARLGAPGYVKEEADLAEFLGVSLREQKI